MTISLGAGWPIAAPAVVRPTRIAETRAVAARARALSAPLSYAREQWLDEVVMRPLVTAGYLAKAGRLYLPGRMPLALAACINLATPGTGDMTPTNSPTFTADAGYDLDGVSSYLNLNYTVLTDFSTTLLKQNSAHMWVRASSIINGVTTLLIGRNSGSVALDLRRSTTNVLQGYANSSSAASFGTVGTAGFFGWFSCRGDEGARLRRWSADLGAVDHFRGARRVAKPVRRARGVRLLGLPGRGDRAWQWVVGC